MSDACVACRALFEKLQAEGKDIVLGCEWCSAQDADSIHIGLQDEDGHETLLSVDWADLEGGDTDGVR